MSEQVSKITRRARSVAEWAPLPVGQAVAAFRQLVTQVASLHQAGRIHGGLSAATVTLDEDLCPAIGAELSICKIGGEAVDGDGPPPELQGYVSLSLPTGFDAARQQLTRDGIDLDPRRIDIYQMGALLCRLLCGESVSNYLRSARVRSLVPAELRPVVDRALGYDADQRFRHCDELAAALNEAVPAQSSPGGNTPSCGSAGLPNQDTPAATRIERLGEYLILSRIGSGGMGEVYKAFDESLERFVAIKVLPPELARQEDFVRRFRAEATAVAKLAHPNIVPIHAIGKDADHHFFVMQYIQGKSLAQLLAQRKRLPVEETLTIVEQSLAALAAAHKRGLIHRDIKPGNILLDDDQHRAMVADFGLVKMMASNQSDTATGVIMGTVDYLSPEQARGKSVDGRSDLYSLGVMMYEMLSGRLPFVSDTPTGMIFQHAYEQPPPLTAVAPDVPQRIAAIVTRLMAKDPGHRYQTAEEAMADIAAVRVGKPPAVAKALPAGGGQSALITAPAAEPLTAIVLPTEAAPGWWRTCRDRLLGLFHAHAPAMVTNLQNTEQQVGGAVAEHERRREELARLLCDAKDVAAEFAAQVASHREAAAEAGRRAESTDDTRLAECARQEKREYEKVAGALASQLAEQQVQLQEIRSRLVQADTTLDQLRSQRDVLHARLRMAQARLAMQEQSSRSGRRRWIPIAGIAGCAVVALVAILLVRAWREQPTIAIIDPAPPAKPASEVLPTLPPPAEAESSGKLNAGVSTSQSLASSSATASDPLQPTTIRAPLVTTAEALQAWLHENAKQLAVSWNRPGWSPNGDQLAYTRPDGRGLEIVSLKTGEVRSLTGPAKDPTWSPNGEHIVFVRGQYPRSEETLWIMPATGGQARLLAKGGFPSWSADSRRVYYQAYREQMIGVVDALDPAAEPQYIFPIQGWYPAVSPDEKYVAYAQSNVLKVFELTSGKLVHTWTAPERQRGMIVAWSPNGRELSVTGYPQTSLGLWILELDNKIMRQVFGGPISNAIWSPEGSLLSVNVGRAYSEIRLWVIPLRPGHSTAATLLSMSAAKLPGNEHK